MNKITGVLGVLLIFIVVINVYMSMSLSSNTTGWQPIMIAATQQYLPLLALVGVILFTIFAVTQSKKG